MWYKLFPGILFLTFLISCGPGNSEKEIEIDMSDIEVRDGNNNKSSGEIQKLELSEGKPIYYNMYLTVEISTLFEKEGAVFEPQILNLIENTVRYISSSEKALNLGVYAVDLTYCRVYEQYQKAGNYFSAMYKLATELGIPEDFFYETADRLEKNITNKDSLARITNEVYAITDKYLKENERENASALIVLGGWIESIYLASKIFDLDKEHEDIEYLKRIKEQRVSLQNLLTLLEKYKNDNVINNLTGKLRELQPVYNKFEIYPDNISASIKQLKKINEHISGIRQEIIR